MAGRILFEFRNSLKSNVSVHLSYRRVLFLFIFAVMLPISVDNIPQ